MTSPTIRIEYLADVPQLIPVCASWAFGLWGCQAGGSFERAMTRFSQGASHSKVPVTLVAFVEGKPAAMVSLWESDLESRLDLSPWLASLYVHPFYRGKGLASLLIGRVETEAIHQGYDRLFLVTEDAAPLYEKTGWEFVEQTQSPYGLATIMRKYL